MLRASVFIFMAVVISAVTFAGDCENEKSTTKDLVFDRIDSPFDKIVFSNEPSSIKALVGDGTLELLKIIEDKRVRPCYKKLRKLGSLNVYVQKLKPQNEGESDTTRFTFVAHSQPEMFRTKITGTLHVDRYALINDAEDSPLHLRVNEDF